MSLTGNMLFEEMENRRLHWKTVDNVEGSYELGIRKAASNLDEVQLDLQQMRVFEVHFTPVDIETQDSFLQ